MLSLHDWMDKLARIMAWPDWPVDVQEKARALYQAGYGTRWAAHILNLSLKK